MFLSKQFLIFLAPIAQVGHNGQTELLDLDRIFLSL
jgi:hypothetical protein